VLNLDALTSLLVAAPSTYERKIDAGAMSPPGVNPRIEAFWAAWRVGNEKRDCDRECHFTWPCSQDAVVVAPSGPGTVKYRPICSRSMASRATRNASTSVASVVTHDCKATIARATT
jgi:hypothetical protein